MPVTSDATAMALYPTTRNIVCQPAKHLTPQAAASDAIAPCVIASTRHAAIPPPQTAVTINGSMGQSDDNIAMTNKKYD